MKDPLPRYTFRVNRLLLDKLRFVARYDGRTINGELEYLARQRIAAFEKEHGPIDLSKDLDESE